MFVELKPLDLGISAKKAPEMYDLLESNRERLAPWFWWANKSVTPDKMRFCLFVLLYIMDTKRKELLHKIKSEKSYDEQFLVYCNGKIAGMCGLDNIDVKKKTAEIWLFTFQGQPFGVADEVIKQIGEHARELGLNIVYA